MNIFSNKFRDTEDRLIKNFFFVLRQELPNTFTAPLVAYLAFQQLVQKVHHVSEKVHSYF